MKIICVGRNYSDHIKELKNEIPEKPVIFLKPDTAVINHPATFYMPDFSKNIHYEAELVIKIHKMGKNIAEKFAHKYYEQITLGIDFTARDIQEACKSKGLPWEIAKGFDGSATIGKFITLKNDIQDIDFTLLKNGETVQKGNSRDMIFSVNKIISYVSSYFTLKTGDLIFTGTPSGVGKIEIGDILEGYVNHEKLLEVKIL